MLAEGGALDRLTERGGTLDRILEEDGILDTLAKLADLEDTLRSLGALEETLRTLGTLGDSLERLAAVAQALEQLAVSTAGLPELSDRVQAVEAQVQGIGEQLHVLCPTLGGLGKSVGSLEDFARQLSEVVVPLGRIVERLPGGKRRGRLDAGE